MQVAGLKNVVFIITIAIKGAVKADLSGSCDMSRCGSPQRIVGAKEEATDISIEETSAKILEWPESETIIWGVRRRQTKYCTPLNDFVPDSCESQMRNYHITASQAREYITSGKCWAGCECDSRNCWGSDSNCCLSEEMTIAGGPKHIPIFEHHRAAWHYTCTSYWECKVEKIVVKTHMVVEGMTFKRMATLMDKRTVTLDKRFYLEGDHYDDGTSVNTLQGDPPKPSIVDAKAKCYSSSKENILCLTRIDNKEIPIEIDYRTMTGTVRSRIVQIIGRINTINNGQLAYITPGSQGNRAPLIINQEDCDDRAVSLSSLKEVIVGVKILQLQEIYNTIANRNQIKRLASLITDLTVFLSQKFPRLLSHITNGDFKTKWLNQEVFLTCPCVKNYDFPAYTNCHEGMIHQDGERTEVTDKSLCFSIGDRLIKNISLVETSKKIDHEIIDYLPPKTASIDDPIWDKIYQDRYRTPDSESTGFDYDKIRSFMSSMNPFLSFKDALLYFSSITSLLYIIQTLSFRR